MTFLRALCLPLLLAACAGPAPEAERDSPPPVPWPESVGAVELERAPSPPAPPLDVTIEVFDTGLAESAGGGDGEPVFAEVRKAEAFYMPMQLREALAASAAWGTVRVVPRPSDTAALAVSGRIVHADGTDLVVDITAEDASGERWLERRYRDRARAADYPVEPGSDPFGDLYRRIANDLLQARRGRATDALPAIALLRFATVLAPTQFTDYLRVDGDGHLALARLPAEGDAMLERLRRLRRQEYLFIDAADQQYAELVERFAPTYHLWRQYARELAEYESDYIARAGDRDIDARRGTYAAMQQTYGRFRRVKIHEQDLQELAAGFDNEVTEIVLDVDDRVYRLSGSLEDQFEDWRRILGEIIALEVGAGA